MNDVGEGQQSQQSQPINYAGDHPVPPEIVLIGLNASDILGVTPASSDRRARIGVDSCAGGTVWPEKLCDDVPTTPSAESNGGIE